MSLARCISLPVSLPAFFRLGSAALCAALVLAIVTPAQAEALAEAPQNKNPETGNAVVTAKVLLQTTNTGDGFPLVYPSGAAMITSRLVEIPPGTETGRHRHIVPLFAYMLEGELTVISDTSPPRRFKAGEAFMETSEWHNGRNEGKKPVRLISVYSGAVDIPLSVKPTP
ncbi:MAG: cupin domain-containing protein [Rhodospirillales bacterium]|nr:cupin domain-containing protein [Rhodospirillales bacterium]